MQAEKNYIPINCWKCKAQNNAALNSVCRLCGCFLKSEAEAGLRSNYTSSFSDNFAFRSLLLSTLAIVVVVAGLLYYYGHWSAPNDRDLEMVAAVGPDAALPVNSWYRKSWWSYLRKHPTVDQILQKNDLIDGRTPTLEAAKTFTVSGKVSRADGDCYNAKCAADRKDAAGTPPGEGADNWFENTYRESGKVEFSAKFPDRVMRKVSGGAAGAQEKSPEVTEVFSGGSGSKTTRQPDGKAVTESLSAEKVSDAKAELKSFLKKDLTGNSGARVRGTEKLNDRTVFAVTSRNKEGERETYYFDTVTGYLVKMDLKEFAIFFEDYRPNEGATVPFTLYYRRAEKEGYYSWTKFEVESWKTGEYIDDAVFESPGV
jgi:hypothetical protein